MPCSSRPRWTLRFELWAGPARETSCSFTRDSFNHFLVNLFMTIRCGQSEATRCRSVECALVSTTHWVNTEGCSQYLSAEEKKKRRVDKNRIARQIRRKKDAETDGGNPSPHQIN
eukprot:m.122067 g.122067  ORF g.122067 m.122067 type:complete len:115 (+) comp21932_c0_seq7:1850-2194(+)